MRTTQSHTDAFIAAREESVQILLIFVHTQPPICVCSIGRRVCVPVWLEELYRCTFYAYVSVKLLSPLFLLSSVVVVVVSKSFA
jgi:hypothetical protein